MLLVALRGALALAGACGFMAAAASTAMMAGSLAFLTPFALLALAALVGTGGLSQTRRLLARTHAWLRTLVIGLAAALRIGHTPLRTVPALAGVYAAAHIGLYLLLTRFTDSTVPFWDAGTTALSVVAMWMLSRKLVEQWLVWLVVDLVTVGLYLYKDLPYTAGLYALYSALAVAGYLRWRRQARA